MASEPIGRTGAPVNDAAGLPQPSAAFSPDSTFSPTPGGGAGRRSSFSSSDSRLVCSPSRGKPTGSTLPSIRSLKSKFLGALSAGSGGGRRGPKVVKGEEARKPIRVVSASVMGKPGGLKGFGGPAGAPSAGLARSASTPASLHSLASPGANGMRPTFSPGEAQPPLPVSVDAMLSSVVEAERSPAIRRDGAISPRPQRAVSAPYDSSALSPHSPHVRSPSHPPLSLPAIRTPSPLPTAALLQPAPSPQKDPIIRPISADFARPAVAPPLLALRKQQQRDSLDVERSLSRSGRRHSRILPGATLPSSLSPLQRTKSLGAPSAEEKRGRHWSVQPPTLHPPLPQPDRSSWDASSNSAAGQQSRPPWARRHSVATSTSVSPKEGEDSPELDEGEKEVQRGRSLSALLGQAKTGLGLGGGQKDGKDGKDARVERDRRPSKPFPGGFEEVPYRPSIDASAFEAVQNESVSPTNASPAAFARPLSLPAMVHEQQARQHRREVSFPDTPPPSAKLNHRQSDSSLVVFSSRRPSVATFNPPPSAPIPPLPPSELTLTLQLQLEANPSVLSATTSTSPPKRVASLPPQLPMRKSKSAIELIPSPFLAASSPSPTDLPDPLSLPVHGAGVVHAASPVYDITAARASVEVSPAPSTPSRRGSEQQARSGSERGDSEVEESPRRRVLSMPDGKSFAQVIEERTRGGRPLDSPLSELIEELKSRQSSVAGSPVVKSPRGGSLARGGPGAGGEEDSEESEEDEDEGEEVGSPYFGRKDSQGDGAHPFMLAAYLDSPVSSPPVGKKRRSNQSIQAPPMPNLNSSVFSSGTVPTVDELASSASSYATALSAPSPPSPFLVPIPSPLATPAAAPANGDSSFLSTPDRSLTLDQMEREIARMEAELALSGRPHSFYDDSTPKAATLSAFSSSSPFPASTSAAAAASTPTLGSLGVPIPPSEPGSPSSTALPFDSSTSSTSSSAPPLSQVTPRTARRWSILEIEKAYDRMKKMLGSSASSTPGVGGRTYAASDITEERSDAGGAEVDFGSEKREEGRKIGGEGEEEQEVLSEGRGDLDVESAFDEALAQASSFTGRDEVNSSTSTRSSWSPNLHLKPLPGLPPPTPSPPPDQPVASVSTSASSPDHVTSDPHPAETTPPTSLPETTSTTSHDHHSLSLEPSREDLSAAPISPEPRETPSRLAQYRLNHSPSHDSLRLASSSGHKRKDSDASSIGGASGIRKLVLPATNQTRLRTRTTHESLRSLSSPVEESDSPRHGSDERVGASSPNQRRTYDSTAAAKLSLPLSPTRRTGPRASSRLSASGPLRSAIGRDLQRLATPEGRRPGEQDEEGDQLFSPSSGSASTSTIAPRRSIERLHERERSGLSVHRLLPPSSSLADNVREPRRRSGTARTAGTGGSDAASWYPVTPHRVGSTNGTAAAGGGRYRSDSASTMESLRGGEEEDERERERSRSGSGSGSGLEESDLAANASLNMASIRGMDKLEIFFKYTAARADLEKAELERDALLDALRETRSTLSDIRRQRDALDQENKRERLLTRQVKKFLGGDPDRYVDKLENLVESRRGWETRAREALEELERAKDELEATRRELVDGREREELLERENVMMGARLAAMEGTRGESPTLKLPLSTNGLPLPSGSTPTPRRSHHGSSSTTGSSAYDDNRPESPTLTMSRSTSEQTALAPSSSKLDFTPVPVPTPTGAVRNASISTTDSTSRRHASKDSFASSSSEIEPTFSSGLGDIGSPLMGQTMAFGPKSSYGSTNASPLKARSSPPTVLPTRRGQFSSLRFGNPPPTTSSSSSLHPLDRLSKISTRTTSTEDDDSESDYADRSFDSAAEGGTGLGMLREKDEAFLVDLTTEFERQVEAGGEVERR